MALSLNPPRRYLVTNIQAMQRLQAFKFELRPNGQQQRQMRSFAGACRFVFNKALALQKTNYEADGKFIGYVAMAKHLTAWRNGTETPWLKEAPVHPLQQTLKDLERAYKNFFAQRAAFPRFKKKGCGESFRYPDAKQFKLDEANGRIFLPKLGWMRLRLSRPVLGKPCNATVSQSGGKWFVSIQTEREVVMPVPQATTAIGIDMGIAWNATMYEDSGPSSNQALANGCIERIKSMVISSCEIAIHAPATNSCPVQRLPHGSPPRQIAASCQIKPRNCS